MQAVGFQGLTRTKTQVRKEIEKHKHIRLKLKFASIRQDPFHDFLKVVIIF